MGELTTTKETLPHGELETEKKIEYDVPTPDWYIQGSAVMDYIFSTTTAQDIDIFYRESNPMPTATIASTLYIHLTPLEEETYFPPAFGTYNTDKYLLIQGAVVQPIGWPPKPTTLEFVNDIVTISEIIRGIKYMVRYNLKISPQTRQLWQEKLLNQYSQPDMKQMFFNSEAEVDEFILFNIEDQCAKAEQKKIQEYVESLLGHQLIES